jgi:hypothetical protein
MRRRFHPATILLSAFTGVAIVFCYHAAQSADKADETKLSHRSIHLAAPVQIGESRFYQVTLTGTLQGNGGEGELTLDPNACGLDAFGDATICTQIAHVTHPVKFVRLRSLDPQGLNRWLYDVNGLPMRAFLVVPVNEKAAFRLVFGSDDDKTRTALTLEPFAPRK